MGGQTVLGGAHQPAPARAEMPISGPAGATSRIAARARIALITIFVFTASQCCRTLTLMSPRRATPILAASAGILVLLAACASVKSTAVHYKSLRNFPAKPPDAQVPILTIRPTRPFKVIGRLAFESDRGWNFLRKSMIYNAQIHGADAVWLKSSRTRREVSFQHMPPRMDWYPVSRRGEHGKIKTGWAPYLRPEPPIRWVTDRTAIDARMIVFDK
jgi:hypothetical protein